MTSVTAEYSGRCYVENSTFLRSKHSMVSRLDSIGHVIMCKTDGADSRFQIVWDYLRHRNWMVDTFNGIQKEIRIDSSAFEDPYNPHYFGLEIMCFIGHSRVCGVLYCSSYCERFWFNGHLDDANVVLRINTVRNIEDVQFTLDTQTQPPTLKGFLGSNFYSYTVDLDNGKLSEVNVTNMHHHLWSPISRNGKLFGFPYAQDKNVNTNKLCEVSLVDRSKIEHEIKESNNTNINGKWDPFLWTNGQLLVGVYDRSKKMSTVHKFDISKMKWEETTIEVKSRLQSMTIVDGMLIVHASSWRDSLNRIYRFQYEAVDSLANLVWLSMRRYSKQNPSFHDWFLSKVPKTHKLRSLWNNRKRRHD